MTYLVATFSKYPVTSHFSTDIETLHIAEALSVVWFDTNASLGFPCYTSEQVPHRIQAHSLLHMQPLIQSQICNRQVYYKKLCNSPKQPFSVRTYDNSALQKLGTITNLQDPYLKTASNVNLSSTESLDIKILFRSDSSFGTQT